MRILVINNLYPPIAFGGYERECAGVVEWLKGEHEVCVLTSEVDRATIEPEAGVIRELPFLEWTPRDSLRAPFASIRAARTARRVLESFSPELIYVWNGAQIPQAALRIVDGSGVPLAYRVCEHWFGHLYGLDKFTKYLALPQFGTRRVWAQLMRLVNRHRQLRLEFSSPARAGICWNSQALRVLSGVPSTVLPVVEDIVYPVTDHAAQFAGVERRPAERTTIIFIGRLEPWKGTAIAYRALASLRSRHRIDARLVVAGPFTDAAYRGELEALARELDLSEQIELRGPLDTAALRALLGEAHAIVIPPTWQEPAPLICTEAAIARVPVVAARSGGIPEMLHDREHALLFPIGDSEACADAIAATLADRSATEERVERAFVRAGDFTLEHYFEQTESFLAATIEALRPD